MGDERAGLGLVGTIALAASLGVGAVALSGVVLGECSAGSEDLERYRASIAAGAEVPVEVGGPDAARITEALRSTRQIRVRNFLGQAGTTCFSVALDGAPPGAERAWFLFEDGPQGRRLKAASLKLGCDCSDDASEPCVLR